MFKIINNEYGLNYLCLGNVNDVTDEIYSQISKSIDENKTSLQPAKMFDVFLKKGYCPNMVAEAFANVAIIHSEELKEVPYWKALVNLYSGVERKIYPKN